MSIQEIIERLGRYDPIDALERAALEQLVDIAHLLDDVRNAREQTS